MPRPLPSLLFTLCLLACTSAQAEVYKWVDENGKVRFSDKAPESQPAEAIGEKIESTNIDSDSKNISASPSRSTEKTQDEIDLEQKKKAEREATLGPLCKKLKHGIDLIASGSRVAFVDENGKNVNVPEKDRGKKLEEWQAAYTQYGCDTL